LWHKDNVQLPRNRLADTLSHNPHLPEQRHQ
jgi:hypothetical protein